MERFYPNLDLKFLASCPICNRHYAPDEIKILEKKEGVVTIYFTCAQCKNAIVSAISAGILGVTAVSIITDLGAAEAAKAKNAEAIDADSVLAVYNFIKTQKKQTNGC